MSITDNQNVDCDYVGKENNLNQSQGNVIFECDNKLPSSVENVINLFKVIKKYRREEKKCDFKTIIAIMNNVYNMNEDETRRCIASLYFDGAISISRDLEKIVFSSKLTGKKNYPTLLRERIRLVLLSSICQMYMKLSLSVGELISEFSATQLLDYFVEENVTIQRIRVTDEFLNKMLDKLCRSGFLSKRDSSNTYLMTNKAIKFGLRIAEFNRYCGDFKIEKTNRTKPSKLIRDKTGSKNNLILVQQSESHPLVPMALSQNLTSNFNTFNNVNNLSNVADSIIFNQHGFPVAIEATPIYSQIIPYCHICGQGSNEKGIILYCRECGVQAHVVCIQFFNWSKSTKWCTSCREPIQQFIENTEEINLLCQECVNCWQNSQDMCDFCQQDMLETNKAIDYLENLELKECIDEILSKSADSTMYSENINNTMVVEDYVPSSTWSFVQLLNESEEVLPVEIIQLKPVNSWTVKDVEKWLIEHGFGSLCAKFRKEEIDGSSLLLLLEADFALMKMEKSLVSHLYSEIKKLKS